MKQLLIIALAIAAPAYGQASVEPRTEEERGALFAYSACVYGFAREMDDGKIAPLSLARKVAPKCRFQLSTAASILSRGKPRSQRDELYQQWLAVEEQRGVRTVLTMRADRRATPRDPADPRQGKPVPPKPGLAKPAVAKPGIAKPAVAKPAVGKPVAKPIPTTGPYGKPMSAWRRAYIAKHGHQPPVAAK